MALLCGRARYPNPCVGSEDKFKTDFEQMFGYSSPNPSIFKQMITFHFERALISHQKSHSVAVLFRKCHSATLKCHILVLRVPRFSATSATVLRLCTKVVCFRLTFPLVKRSNQCFSLRINIWNKICHHRS